MTPDKTGQSKPKISKVENNTNGKSTEGINVSAGGVSVQHTNGTTSDNEIVNTSKASLGNGKSKVTYSNENNETTPSVKHDVKHEGTKGGSTAVGVTINDDGGALQLEQGKGPRGDSGSVYRTRVIGTTYSGTDHKLVDGNEKSLNVGGYIGKGGEAKLNLPDGSIVGGRVLSD